MLSLNDYGFVPSVLLYLRSDLERNMQNQPFHRKIILWPVSISALSCLDLSLLFIDISSIAIDWTLEAVEKCSFYLNSKRKNRVQHIKLSDFPFELTNMIFFNLPLSDRIAFVKTCKTFNKQYQNIVLHYLADNDVLEYLKMELIYSKQIQHRYYKNIFKDAVIPIAIRTLESLVKHTVITVLKKIAHHYCTSWTQEDCGEHNKKYNLPRQAIDHEGSSYTINAATIEGIEMRNEFFKNTLPTFARVSLVAIDLFSLYKILKRPFRREFLEKCVEYPLSIASDPVLSQYVVPSTGKVPLLPCFSLLGVYHDHLDSLKNSWKIQQSSVGTIVLDLNSFRAIQNRIAVLKAQGDPLVEGIYCFKGL